MTSEEHNWLERIEKKVDSLTQSLNDWKLETVQACRKCDIRDDVEKINDTLSQAKGAWWAGGKLWAGVAAAVTIISVAIQIWVAFKG